jgi:hypothetical protein
MESLDDSNLEEKYYVIYSTKTYVLNPLLYSSDLFKTLIQTGDKEFHLKEYEDTFRALNTDTIHISLDASVDEINSLNIQLDYFGYEPSIEYLNKKIFEIELCREYKNTYDFLDTYKDDILFESFSNTKLPLEFCEKYKFSLSKDYLSSNKNITEEFILRNLNIMNLYSLNMHYNFSVEFLEKYSNIIKWHPLALNKHIQESFLEKYITFEGNNDNSQFWIDISSNTNISEEFLEKYIHKINLTLVSKNTNITERFVRKHIDKLDFYYLSQNTSLSNEFFDTYSKKIHWERFSQYNNISDWFYDKYEDKIVKDELSKNQNLTQEFIKKYIHIFNEKLLIIYNRKLPFEFVYNTLEKFKNIRLAISNKSTIFISDSYLLEYLLNLAPEHIIVYLQYDNKYCSYLSQNKNLSEEYIANLITRNPNILEEISSFKSITISILRKYCNLISPITLTNFSIGPALRKVKKYKSTQWHIYIDDLFDF